MFFLFLIIGRKSNDFFALFKIMCYFCGVITLVADILKVFLLFLIEKFGDFLYTRMVNITLPYVVASCSYISVWSIVYSCMGYAKYPRLDGQDNSTLSFCHNSANTFV